MHRQRTTQSKRDTAIWGAVAMQQHLAAELQIGGVELPGMHHSRRTRHKRPTLAQKIGYVEQPRRLTETEWSEVKSRADKRDSSEPCAVCHEHYSDKTPQVILSCSHVFHKQCVESLEKFAKRQRDATAPSCPLCRKKDYETKLHDAGVKQHRHRMATRLQALWRGFSSRRAVLHWRLETDPIFREELHFQLVRKMSDDAMRQSERGAQDLDALFAKLDRERSCSLLGAMTQGDWDKARGKLLQRGIGECSICLTSLAYAYEPGGGVDNDAKGGDAKDSVLLSCSHAFHAPCLASFEEFDRNTEAADRRCPICREPYVTQPLIGDAI